MPTTINDELTRIEGAKADIATAIDGKGVTVPANAKIDDFADLIDAIQAGGLTWNDVVKKTATTITLTEDVDLTGIGENQFSNYKNLVSINFPNGLKTIGEKAFNVCTSLISVTLPNTLKTLGSYSFAGCTSLTSVSLSNSLTSIGICSFQSCNFSSIVVPDSVTSKLRYVFRYDSALTTATIGSGCTGLGTACFYGCSSLNTLIIRGTNCTLDTTDVFDGTPIKTGTGKIYVPNGYGETYKAMTNWSTYANQIYELDSNGNIPT